MKIECPICFGKLKPPYLILGERWGFHLSCVISTLLSAYTFGIADDLTNDMRFAVGVAEAKTKKRRRKPRHE
jgi:hypothetical protein